MDVFQWRLTMTTKTEHPVVKALEDISKSACLYPVDTAANALPLARDLVAASEDNEALRKLIRNFDVAIRKIATELTGKACGGVDTEDSINPETGEPYGPGGHTGWLLATEARKLREERDRAVTIVEAAKKWDKMPLSEHLHAISDAVRALEAKHE